MRIGIDIHGTIDYDPRAWKQIIDLLLALGHRIHIVSGPEEEKIIKRLQDLDIAVSGLYIESVADYIKEKGIKYWYEGGSIWTTDEDWWKTKAEICNENGIDLMIDDQVDYYLANWRDIAPNTSFILYQRGRFVCEHKT